MFVLFCFVVVVVRYSLGWLGVDFVDEGFDWSRRVLSVLRKEKRGGGKRRGRKTRAVACTQPTNFFPCVSSQPIVTKGTILRIPKFLTLTLALTLPPYKLREDGCTWDALIKLEKSVCDGSPQSVFEIYRGCKTPLRKVPIVVI